jgi:hypothetical protein
VGVEVRRDLGQHLIRTIQHFVVPESQEAPATTMKIGTALRVTQVARSVLRPISLDDKLCPKAREIHDIGWNRMLPAKVPAGKLWIVENPPELTFGPRRLTA